MVLPRSRTVCIALLAAACGSTLVADGPTARAADVDPPRSVLSSARTAIEDGRTAEARSILEPLAAEYADSAKLQHHLGLAYEKERRYELAAGKFQRALELDPDLHDARAPYGWCLYYLGELDHARSLLESHVAVAPTDAGAFLALGLIEMDAHRVDGARARFLQAAEASRARKDTRTEALARARLADVELGAGQLETARRLLVVAIGLDPRNQSYYFKLSRVLQRIGDSDGALRVLELREKVLSGATE